MTKRTRLTKEEKLIGWVGRMMKDGKTVEQMSIALNQPKEVIEEYVKVNQK